jgi:hypothetical protein
MPLPDESRIVITGIGLTAPNGNSIKEFRQNLLAGISGVVPFETRYMPPVIAGVCDFEVTRHQKRKEARRGTRAGQVAVYCANEAVQNSGIDWESYPRDRVGVYLGITEHGNVETENEIYEMSRFDNDVKVWSHHHNPRTVANNPAGEVTKVCDLEAVNGVTCSGSKVYAVSSGLHEVYEIDPEGKKEPEPFALADSFLILDCIEVLDDGSFIVSDWKGNMLYSISADRKTVTELMEIKGVADFAIDRKKGLLFAPGTLENKAYILKIKQ